jgi:ABC-type molybdenum transport system ATPase subunit/photorepair protein PhrA
VSPKRKPSTQDIRTMLSQAVPPPTSAESLLEPDKKLQATSTETAADASALSTAIGWRKSTIPFREDQHKEIGHLLSKLHHEFDVQLTIAEVVRLGLDKMIQALSDDTKRDEALRDLYQQQQRESQGNENLKHSRSRGLSRYLGIRNLVST